MKKLAGIILAVILMLGAFALADDQLKLMEVKQLEGTQDVRMYVHAENEPTGENLTVFMNGSPMRLPMDIQPVSQTQQGTVYVFCLDVSGTIADKDLNAACDELIRFSEQLGANDLMRVYVIGSGATPLCDYTADPEVVRQALAQMPRRTRQTFLWEAIRIAADDLTENRDSLPELAQIIVFSDGVDDSNQTGSAETALESVQRAGMPLRIVQMSSSERNADTSQIEWLCEQSGGVMFDGRRSFADGLEKLHETMNGDYCVTASGVPYSMLSGESEWFVQQRGNGEVHASNILSCALSQAGVPAPTPVPVGRVRYAYDGEVPGNAPALPAEETHTLGDRVTVAPAPSQEGYVFSGWSIGDFEMPAGDVTITGTWTINRHTVRYAYAGETPAGAPALPEDAEYGYGQAVTVAADPALEGYTFDGWSREDFTMPDADVVITGSWTVNRYSVSYAYLGDDTPATAPALPAPAEYAYGEIVTVAATPATRGYGFSGWSTGDFTMPAQDVVISGAWTLNHHPVSYAYGGEAPEGAPALPETAEHNYGETVIVAEVPTLEGYTFSGWNRASFVMPDDAVTISGSWTVNRHTVRYAYDGEAPANAPALPVPAIYDYGESVTVMAAPSLEGYTFGGWSEADFTMPDADVTIHGGWTINTHTVYYAYDGEAPLNAPALPRSENFDYGAQVPAAAVPEMEGYTFGGWSAGDFAMPDADVTVHGGWTINTHTVSYAWDGEAPENAPELPEAASYDYGAQVAVDAAPTMEGYTFGGWSAGDFTMPDEDVTVTGGWTVNTHTVSYAWDGEAPEDAPELPEAAEYDYGAQVPAATVPEMEGYTFGGWSAGDFAMPDADVTVHGGWTINAHTVSYVYDGEVPENAPELPEATEYNYGAQVAVAADPALEGYTFGGWSANDFEMPDADVVIHGGWTVNTHTVSYAWDGEVPEDAPELPEAAEYNYGAQVPAAATPTMRGYTFGGWSAGDFEMPDADVVIHGGWTINTHTVSYAWNGEVPENAPELPEAAEYDYGAEVPAAAEPALEGFIFSGWNMGNFTMPDADVVVRGGWSPAPTPVPVSNLRWTMDGATLEPGAVLDIEKNEVTLSLQADGDVAGMDFRAKNAAGEDVSSTVLTQAEGDASGVVIHRKGMTGEEIYTLTGTVTAENAETGDSALELSLRAPKKVNLVLIAAIAGAVLLLAALLIVLLAIRRRSRKAEEPPVSPAPRQPAVKKKVEPKYGTLFSRELIFQETLGDEETRERRQVVHDGSLIGRVPECDVYYNGGTVVEQTISRRQARLRLDSAGNVYIEPIEGTRNPTVVDGVEIHDRTRLKSGSTVEMGEIKWVIRSVDVPEKN